MRIPLARIGLLGILSPFLVAFGPPDSAGTFVSVTGGGGRASYTTSSCGYTQHIRSAMYHGGVAIDHRERIHSPRTLLPGVVSVGVSAHTVTGNTYQFSTQDEPWTGERLDETRDRWRLEGVGARVGLDWRYVGLTMGALSGNPEFDLPVIPTFGLRIGRQVFYTLSLVEQPLDPMALGETGFGLKTEELGFWYGVRIPYQGALMPTFKMYRVFRNGEIGVNLMASPFGDERMDYGASVTAGFRLPDLFP